MRTDLIESVLIGGSVGLLALAIHAWTDGAATYVQVLALALAGVLLAGVQLAFSNRRRQLPGAPGEPPGPSAPPARHPRRNQFLRELNSDWVGLDGAPPEQPAPEDEQDATEQAGPRPGG